MSYIIEKPTNAHSGWYELAARRQPGVNVERMVCSCVESVTVNTVRLDFCSLGEPYKRGPRKGQPRFLNDTVSVYVQRHEARALLEAYEEQSGQCGQCIEGKAAIGWSKETGTRYATCNRCNGTGLAKAKGGAE